MAETRWAQRLKLLAGALCLALSSAGGLPAIMPGDEPRPDVTSIQVDVDNKVMIGEPDDEAEVVDAELVEDEGEQEP